MTFTISLPAASFANFNLSAFSGSFKAVRISEHAAIEDEAKVNVAIIFYVSIL